MGNCCSCRRKGTGKENSGFRATDRSQGGETLEPQSGRRSLSLCTEVTVQAEIRGPQVYTSSGALRNRRTRALEVGHLDSVDPVSPPAYQAEAPYLPPQGEPCQDQPSPEYQAVHDAELKFGASSHNPPPHGGDNDNEELEHQRAGFLEFPPTSPQVQSPNTVAMFHGAHGFNLGSVNSTVIEGNQTNNVTHIHQNESSAPTMVKLRQEIREWLKAPKFFAIHQASKEVKTEGTGAWFLQSSEMEEFMRKKGQILWCTGKPGSGKTILASITIQYLEDLARLQSGVAVIYAYLRYSEKHTLREVLLGLLDHLLTLDVAVAKAEPSFRQLKQSGAHYTVDEIVSLISDILNCLNQVYAIVDGLDEASEGVKDGLLVKLPPLGLNLLFFSRPLELYQHHTPNAVYLSIQARTCDIALYISEQYKTNSRLKALLDGKPEPVEQLSNKIQQQADGMFLLARLQLESAMCSATSAKKLFQVLDDLPSGVYDMYDLTVKRINDQPEEILALAERVFVWLLYHLDRHHNYMPGATCIQTALAVSVDNRAYDGLDKTPVDLILSACHGLVTQSQGTGGDEDSVHLRFIHYSMEEYAKGIQFSAIRHPHSFLAATCVVYLDPYVGTWIEESEAESETESEDESETESEDESEAYSEAELTFRNYARAYWGFHARLSQDQGEELHPAIVWALSRRRLYPLDVLWGWDSLLIPGLSVAAWYGLVDVIKSKTLDFPAPQPRHYVSHPHHHWKCNMSTPFHSAASSHDINAFIALLSAYGGKGQAHIWACSRDNAQSTILHAAIRAAGYHRQTAFIRQLFAFFESPPTEEMRLASCNFDINAGDENGVTPLMVACSSIVTDAGLLRLLVEHGANLNAVDSHGRTAFMHLMELSYPVFKPSEVIERAQFFLSLQPSLIEQRDRNGATALIKALVARRGRTWIRFLISEIEAYFSSRRELAQSTNARETTLMYDAPSDSLWPPEEVCMIGLSAPALEVRATDRQGRGILEIVCSTNMFPEPPSKRTVDPFPILYALLDVEGGWDAHLIRKAVIAGVRNLEFLTVYRLLQEDWVVYSFDWSTSHSDTVTLLVQAASRTSSRKAIVNMVLENLKILKRGRLSPLHAALQAKLFKGRRQYTLAELEQRIRKTPPDQM